MSALKAGVSREGQTLYLAITKMIDEVTWDGPNIVVFNDVVITPPYTVESVNGNPGSRQLTYVKKIVEKHTSTLLLDSSGGSSVVSDSYESSGGGGGGGGVGVSSSNINNSSSNSNSAPSPSTTAAVSKNSF